MSLPIVERAREALAGRDLAGVLDDAVIARFELLPAEVKALAALLLTDGNFLAALPLTGQKPGLFEMAVENLARKKLIGYENGKVDLTPLQQQLRVEQDAEAEFVEELPQPKVVLRSIPEQVAALARSSNNGPQALGRAYSFIFGRRATNFPILGRYVKEFGSASKAARFLLDHMLDDHAGKDPLMALLPLAISTAAAIRAGGWRPESAPDVEEQRREVLQADRNSWEARMRRWLSEGTLEHNLANIDYDEHDARTIPGARAYSAEQAEADRRQVRIDFERWEREGRPTL